MSGKGDNVKVVVRCRPLSSTEQAQGHSSIVSMDTVAGAITIQPPASAAEPPKQFTFDAVFDAQSAQVHVYNTVARPIVENVLEGYNGTIFAYGQTGTGKTFSAYLNSL